MAVFSRRVPFLLLGVALLVITGCSNNGGGPEDVAPLPDDVGPVTADPTVAVGDNWFEPEQIVVAAGTEVTWVWEGRAAHDVVGDGFRSEVISEGEFSHTFADEGAYHYVCTLHPGMEGTVYVVPEEH